MIEKTDTFITSNTSFVNVTGLALTITPHSANNKIIVPIIPCSDKNSK